jgi:hypothetical protein
MIDELDKRKRYDEYEPHKYNCIAVEDDWIIELLPDLSRMKTFFHSFDRPDFGLAYTGVTLIPVESLDLFYDVVTSSPHAHALQELAQKIAQAKEQGKWMIHFGI